MLYFFRMGTIHLSNTGRNRVLLYNDDLEYYNMWEDK